MAESKDGKWKDPSGDWIPLKYIDPIVKYRDKIVTKHLNRAKKLQKDIRKFKMELEKDIDAYWEKEREEYGADSSNPGQNKRLEDFANRMRIELNAHQAIDFDDRVWIARDKLFEYVEEAAVGGKDVEGLKIIVKNAYATNRFGKLDKSRIMSLMALGEKIKNPKVQEACEIIRDCIRRLDRKVYFKFMEKGKAGEWTPVELNFPRV